MDFTQLHTVPRSLAPTADAPLLLMCPSQGGRCNGSRIVTLCPRTPVPQLGVSGRVRYGHTPPLARPAAHTCQAQDHLLIPWQWYHRHAAQRLQHPCSPICASDGGVHSVIIPWIGQGDPCVLPHELTGTIGDSTHRLGLLLALASGRAVTGQLPHH